MKILFPPSEERAHRRHSQLHSSPNSCVPCRANHGRSTRESGRVSPDIWGALAALAIGLFLTSWFGLIVARLERPRHVIVAAIPRGEERSFFFHNEICFGEIETSLRVDKNPVIRGKLFIRTKLHGRLTDVQAAFLGQFNPLGQLVRGEASLTAPDVSAKVVVRGVTPLRVRLSGIFGGRSLGRDVAVPGPVTLYENDEVTHRIEYAALPFTLDSSAIDPLRRLIEGELRVIPATADTQCPPDGEGRFDLAPLTEKVAPLIGLFNTHAGGL